VGIPVVGTSHRPRRTEQGALHHSAPSLSLPRRFGIQIFRIPSTPGAFFPAWRSKLACNPSGSYIRPIKALNRHCGSARARCVKRISPVVMVTIRSVSGHVALIRYLKPTPLCSVRITRLHRSYGCPRLPTATALFLAFYTCPRVRTPCAPTFGSPWLSRTLNVRLDTTSDPGVAIWSKYSCGFPIVIFQQPT
jgi:hypothetical protein